MSTYRFKALEAVLHRKEADVKLPDANISSFFGENVFNEITMKEYLSDEAFSSVMEAMNKGERIDRRIADQIASAMKAWAMSKGATHYTHWFQPLTGRTAEKHDSFFNPLPGGRAMEKFDGAQLVQQEPDASSFPNGGLRDTFEARGYTAWDPTSPAFILDKTLCIPTIFVSYTGEALDYKAPLLKALHAIDQAAVEVAQYFDKNITKVTATLGWEQEYFLVDSALFDARPDLILTGRTLFGHSSSRGQQLSDHYFGSIPKRATAFMRDFETEALRLGIPVRTRHNEVAPNQFECAPVFEEANLSVDHNSLIMDVMEKVAARHNFRVLLHEKPFSGINGSGKHNNWSLATDTGVNLLSPGKTPRTNLRFLTFFVNTIKAVHQYPELMRACIASASNDHRLGANEAPPAITSIFIGSQLTEVLKDLEERIHSGDLTPDDKTDLKLRIGRIPEILLDNTDRNRTSPFAFTGNKFEYRAVGSAANCALPMMVLNSIVAKQLKEFKVEVDALIDAGTSKDEALFKVLKDYIVSSKSILFEGNGYSQAWVEEAEKRGLPNLKTTPEALEAYETEKAQALFTELNIMSLEELEARTDVNFENYKLKIQIESRVIGDLASSHIIPAVLKYQGSLVETLKGLKDIFGADYVKNASAQIELLNEIVERVNKLRSYINSMIEERKKANKLETAKEQAFAYCNNVKPYFDQIRYEVDKLELIVDDNLWPLPKYREILFTR